MARDEGAQHVVDARLVALAGLPEPSQYVGVDIGGMPIAAIGGSEAFAKSHSLQMLAASCNLCERRSVVFRSVAEFLGHVRRAQLCAPKMEEEICSGGFFVNALFASTP